MFRLIVFFSLVFIVGFSGCKQPVSLPENLSFNPHSGVLYKLSVTKIENEQWTYHDKPRNAADTSKAEYSLQLLRKTDTAFLLKLQFENFIKQGGNIKVNTNTAAGSFEAAKENPNLLYNYLLHFTKGKYVTVWMNKKGRPVQINGIERLVDTVSTASGVPTNITRLYLRDFISDEVIKDELNKLFCFIPDKPKTVGQSWVENIILIAKAPVKWSTDFKMRYNDKDTAAIECHSFISAQQGDAGRTYMKGKLAGTIMVEYSSGIPYNWTAESETITTTDNYDITDRQSISATIVPVKR